MVTVVLSAVREPDGKKIKDNLMDRIKGNPLILASQENILVW